MKNINILWVDDEIDLLKAHIIFLQEKGYTLTKSTNGLDAIEQLRNNNFDLIFLDENMPGMSGIETLGKIKTLKPDIPVVMVTKNEEEDIMEEAIASKISDYLIKPVNPNQILLSIKKNIDHKRLISEKTTSNYQVEFSKIGMDINYASKYVDWAEIYKKLVYWELELSGSQNDEMKEILQMQKNDANNNFMKYIRKNYLEWFSPNCNDKPILSPNIMKEYIFPLLDNGDKVFFIVLDNLRLDQWRLINNELKNYYSTELDEVFCSILPTATQYSRNAIFSGLMPYEIDKIVPDLWLNDEDEGMKNKYEEQLLVKHLARHGKKYKYSFEKIFNKQGEKKILRMYNDLLSNDLNVLVYNFIDILSHARTNVEMVKELADDEPAYRSITLSWFKHSYLFEMLKKLADEDIKVVISTDHGSIKVTNPVKVTGDKETSSNLRFKSGKNLSYNSKEVFEIKDLKKAHLPERHINYDYIFAGSNDFFVYPNNYNHFANYYKNTFQHGGISLEEMLIPIGVLTPLKR